MLELAQPSDWEEINRISRQVQALHVSWRPDLFQNTQLPYPRDYFLEEIREKHLFSAKVNGTVVGYVKFYIWKTSGTGSVPRTVMNIDDICVEETCRHQGIGFEMMQDLRALARVFGCTDIQLSVYPQNDAAIAFYQKCGFTIKSIDMQTKL